MIEPIVTVFVVILALALIDLHAQQAEKRREPGRGLNTKRPPSWRPFVPSPVLGRVERPANHPCLLLKDLARRPAHIGGNHAFRT